MTLGDNDSGINNNHENHTIIKISTKIMKKKNNNRGDITQSHQSHTNNNLKQITIQPPAP